MSKKKTRQRRQPEAPPPRIEGSSGRKKTVLVLSGVALFAALLVGTAAYYARPVDEPTAATKAPAASAAALVRFHSPTKGETSAKVHIVEFLDPACETCSRFYPFVNEFMKANPGRVRVSIRYAPFHSGSKEVVRLLEAARKQGKFWETLEALLGSQRTWVVNHTARLDLAWSAIQGVGLQIDRVKQDMQSAEIDRVIQQDLEDAVALNVTQTPEFFVNGRPMPSFGFEQLRSLVERALREQYGSA